MKTLVVGMKASGPPYLCLVGLDFWRSFPFGSFTAGWFAGTVGLAQLHGCTQKTKRSGIRP